VLLLKGLYGQDLGKDRLPVFWDNFSRS
jgi:hypothetical protein